MKRKITIILLLLSLLLLSALTGCAFRPKTAEGTPAQTGPAETAAPTPDPQKPLYTGT